MEGMSGSLHSVVEYLLTIYFYVPRRQKEDQ